MNYATDIQKINTSFDNSKPIGLSRIYFIQDVLTTRRMIRLDQWPINTMASPANAGGPRKEGGPYVWTRNAYLLETSTDSFSLSEMQVKQVNGKNFLVH